MQKITTGYEDFSPHYTIDDRSLSRHNLKWLESCFSFLCLKIAGFTLGLTYTFIHFMHVI